MKQIQIGNYNTFDDFNMILNSIEIESPAPKTKKIAVEGGDGDLDLTEMFGRVTYENRRIKADFTLKVPASQFLTVFSDIQNKIQGQKLPITLEDDPDYYYVGRVSMDGFAKDRNIGLISMECDCEPYKNKHEVTIVSQAVDGTAIVNLQNLKRRVVPVITTDASMTFEYGNGTYNVTHNAGTFMLSTLELVEGDNLVTITGTGNVAFSYLEGGL